MKKFEIWGSKKGSQYDHIFDTNDYEEAKKVINSLMDDSEYDRIGLFMDGKRVLDFCKTWINIAI